MHHYKYSHMNKYLNKQCLRAMVLLLLLATGACKKYENLEVPSPDSFQVTTARQTYRLADTVTFNLSAGPDQIVFYSGEPGNNYSNINRTLAAGINKLRFRCYMVNGSLLNKDSLRLLISTNLRRYDSAGVRAATWTDITDRNTKWPTALSTTYTVSDSVDLSDYKEADSVFLAFKVLGKKNPLYAQRRWVIDTIKVMNILPDGTVYPLLTGPYLYAGMSTGVSTPAYTGTSSVSYFAYSGLFQVNMKNNLPPVSLTDATLNYNAWNVGTYGINFYNSPVQIPAGSAATLRGCNNNGIEIRTTYPVTFEPGPAVDNDDNEDWLITAPVRLKTVRPDVGITIKNPINLAVSNFSFVLNNPAVYATYKYRFSRPGIYNVVFVAQNRNQDKVSQVIRQVQITVTP
jgi:hypothetical protein